MIKKGVKVKRASFLMGIKISTIYYKSVSSKHKKDKALYIAICQIAYKFSFYGYRRIYLVLRQMGFIVNHKKVYRIYRELNLQKTKKTRQKNKIISKSPSLSEANKPNEIWSIDFAFDRIASGKLVKIMPIIDICSRFCIGTTAEFSITGEDVVDVIEKCFEIYGKPKIIRTDRGSEFRSREFEKFLERSRVKHEFINKGSPWENGIIESFIGKLREECLNMHEFSNLEEMKEIIEGYRRFYNFKRPHSGLGGKTPYECYKNFCNP